MATYELYTKEEEDEVTLVLRMSRAEFQDFMTTSEEEDALGNLEAFSELADRLMLSKKRTN